MEKETLPTMNTQNFPNSFNEEKELLISDFQEYETRQMKITSITPEEQKLIKHLADISQQDIINPSSYPGLINQHTNEDSTNYVDNLLMQTEPELINRNPNSNIFDDIAQKENLNENLNLNENQQTNSIQKNSSEVLKSIQNSNRTNSQR